MWQWPPKYVSYHLCVWVTSGSTCQECLSNGGTQLRRGQLVCGVLFLSDSGTKIIHKKGGRSRRQHSVSVQIYISMPYTNLGTKRHRHRKHLFEGNIQYKGCGTKGTMVKASNLFFFFFSDQSSRYTVEHWGFCLGQMEVNTCTDSYTITHWLKEGWDILKDTHRTFKRTCYHFFFFFSFNKNRHGLSSLEIPSQ